MPGNGKFSISSLRATYCQVWRSRLEYRLVTYFGVARILLTLINLTKGAAAEPEL